MVENEGDTALPHLVGVEMFNALMLLNKFNV